MGGNGLRLAAPALSCQEWWEEMYDLHDWLRWREPANLKP